MKLDMKLMREFYLNWKKSNHAELERIVSSNADALLNWLPTLLDGSFAQSSALYRDAASDWSGGDMLNSYEVFSVACAINDALARLKGSAGEGTMYKCGTQIAQRLDAAADELTQKGIAYGAEEKRHQAQAIRKMIAQRYERYAK